MSVHCKFYPRSNMRSGFDFRVFLYSDHHYSRNISFWHDITCFNPSDSTYNAVVEVPIGDLRKLEMSKEQFNPIKQDTRMNKITKEKFLRYNQLSPFFNYGLIPQTWENNQLKHFPEGYYGDNDPLDMIELSEPATRREVGEVFRVYAVGSFCLIDQCEVDWKILTVDASTISHNEACDYIKYEKVKQKIRDIQYYFKVYKTYEGKKLNYIYANDRIFNKDETEKVILTHYKYYKDMLSNKKI